LNGGRTCPVPQIQNCIIPPITDISPPSITKGDITNSTDKFMIFTTETSSFTVRSGGVICDILMIGGGSPGGFGGGGAGACIVAIGHTLPAGDYNVTVGPGGIKYFDNYNYTYITIPGGDSSISVNGTTLYLAKGGGNGATSLSNGNPGGCGGGAGPGWGSTRSGGKDVSTNIVNTANGVISTGPTIPIQPTYAVFGNKGGDQQNNTNHNSTFSCPGGGGIGATGGNQALIQLNAGPGGAGLNEATINGITYNFKSYFANNNIFGHNNNGYIGGGGGGFARFITTRANGGIGGGGIGASMLEQATPGAANTGSGGGGENANIVGNSSGGSGIVIIRYRS
jgi:hypothetical protein